jgi:dipeptide/tripeptide permease
MIVIAIIVGLVIGILWYLCGERFDKKSMTPTCWERLHYYNKERFPLFLVHIKSILAGLVLIWLAFSNFKYKNEMIATIGSAIIGLHIFQWYDEQRFILSKGE